jgi:hypothetical protein
MKKQNQVNIWLFLIVVSFFSMLSSCTKDDPELDPSQLIQGSWKCEEADGDWYVLNFISTSDLIYKIYHSSNGEIETYEFSFVVDESTVFLTSKESTSKSAHNYVINGSELIFRIDTTDFLFLKEY